MTTFAVLIGCLAGTALVVGLLTFILLGVCIIVEIFRDFFS